MDKLSQILLDGIEVIRQGCQQLKKIQLYEVELSEFEKSLDRATAEVRNYELKAKFAMEQEMHILSSWK